MSSLLPAKYRLLPLVIALAAAGPAPALAQEAPKGDDVVLREPDPVVTAEARAVLDRMKAYMNSLQAFSVTAQASRDVLLPYGYKLQSNESAKMTVQRPNRMRVDVEGDIKQRSYYYDGTTLTMFAPDAKVYAQTPAPGTVGEVVNGLLNAGVEMPLIDVLRQAFEGTLTEGVRYGLRVGDSTINGVVTDHLAFRQSTIDWQLWVAKNGQPRKLLITTRYETGDPQYQVFLDWNSSPKVDAKSFTFTAPDGVRKIPFYAPGMTAAAARP